MPQTITLPAITLSWSPWHSWTRVGLPSGDKHRVEVPKQPGVYEVAYLASGPRLTIGRARDLRRRVRRQLVVGKGRHPAGRRIRKQEDVAKLKVRWAITDRPGGVEEELHLLHRQRFGQMPKYAKGTAQ